MAAKQVKQATTIDVTEFGFRLPAALPAYESGETAFDAAIATLFKKCESMAKKREREAIPLPARLTKPKPTDVDHVIALLGPAALDVGVCKFDMDRGRDDDQYVKAYQATIAAREPRELFVTALVSLALQDERGETHVRALLPDALANPTLGTKLVDALLASLRPLSAETLAGAPRLLDNEGDPRAMFQCWNAGARAAIATDPGGAFERLSPWIATPRAKAIADALRATSSIDPRWRDTLLPLARQGHEIALGLLLKLPPDAEILDAFASHLQREADQTGFMISQWAFEHLVAHADDAALARFPAGIAGSVAAARSKS